MKALLYNFYLIIFILSALVSCKPPTDERMETLAEDPNEIMISKKQFETGGMKLGRLTKRQLTTTVSTRGYIDVPPGNRAAVSPFYGGYVKRIDVLPGQEIRRGELLFTLQSPEYLKMQQSYLEIKAQLEYLKIDFERQQTLAGEKIASEKNFKKAESDYRVMQAKYQGLKEQLKLMRVPLSKLERGELTNTIAIYAPIAGFITSVNTMKSAFINASEVALEIVNTDHIHLELQVFEKDAMLIRPHQKINFSVPETSNKAYTGEVHLVGQSVDTKQRTVAIHGHISEKEEGRFIPGMYVNAEIEVRTQVAMCLPSSAIVEMGGVNYVFVQTKEENDVLQFAQQQVSLLKKSGDWVEIRNTEEIKDKTILIKGSFNLIRE